jgi:hypothetical protein
MAGTRVNKKLGGFVVQVTTEISLVDRRRLNEISQRTSRTISELVREAILTAIEDEQRRFAELN